jgi:hypothetical protein
VADASIFVGVAIIIAFQKSYFKEEQAEESDSLDASQTPMVEQASTDDEEPGKAQSVG